MEIFMSGLNIDSTNRWMPATPSDQATIGLKVNPKTGQHRTFLPQIDEDKPILIIRIFLVFKKVLILIEFRLFQGNFESPPLLKKNIQNLRYTLFIGKGHRFSDISDLNKLANTPLTTEAVLELAKKHITNKDHLSSVRLYCEVGNYSKALGKINEYTKETISESDLNSILSRSFDLIEKRELLKPDQIQPLKEALEKGNPDFIYLLRICLKAELQENKKEAGAKHYFLVELRNIVSESDDTTELAEQLTPLLYMHEFYERSSSTIKKIEDRQQNDVVQSVDKIRAELNLGFKADENSPCLSDHFSINFAYYKGLLQEKLEKLDPNTLSDTDRKSALIFTCSYGTGHKITAQAVESYFKKNNWNAQTIDTTNEISVHSEFLYKVFKISSADIFNKMLANQTYFLIKVWQVFGKILNWIGGYQTAPGVEYPCSSPKSLKKKLLIEKILLHRPDTIVTTYHMDLNPITEIANSLGLPVAHVATDMNPKMQEVYTDEKTLPKHCKISLPFEDDWIDENAAPMNKDRRVVNGIPIRSEFFDTSSEEIDFFKRERGIDDTTKSLFIMSGGNGQKIPFPELLANSKEIKEKHHIFLVIGNNTAFANDLQKNLTRKPGTGNRIELQGSNPNVTIELVQDDNAPESHPYRVGAKKIALAMGASRVAIIKPGGLSIFEALFSCCAIIADATGGWLSWEKENMDLVERQKRGLSLEEQGDLSARLEEAFKLETDFNRETFKRNASNDFFKFIVKLDREAKEDTVFSNKNNDYKDFI